MKTVLSGIQAVLFDLDGTLVDTNIDFPGMREGALSLAESYGLSKEDLANRDILEIIEEARSRLADAGRVGEACDFSADAETLLEEIELRHAQSGEMVDGAGELLSALHDAGIKVGIVTRNCRSATELALKRAGLTCDVVVTREDVERTKPDPSHLLAALALLRAAPEKSLMVGDYTIDVEAGKAAGMRTVGVLRPNRPPDFFDALAPDAVITSLRDMLDALVNLHR